MKVRISVTQKDIDTAHEEWFKREHLPSYVYSNKCPVARAVKRRLKTQFEDLVLVDEYISISDKKGLIKEIKIPQKTTDFILSFDRLKKSDSTDKLNPFTFNIDIPKKYLKETK